MFTDYRPPVYLPCYSFASANCLPPTCPPMSTDYRQPVYLSSYSFASATANHRPVNPCPLTTCLLPICTPLIFYMPRADLSTIDLCFYSFLSANCLPYYHRSVHICPLTTCLQRLPAHQCPLNASLLPTCPFICSMVLHTKLLGISIRKLLLQTLHVLLTFGNFRSLIILL